MHLTTDNVLFCVSIVFMLVELYKHVLLDFFILFY